MEHRILNYLAFDPMSTKPAAEPNPAIAIKHRVVLPIQTRGNIGKSTEAIARAEWMNARSVSWQGFDLDKANRTFNVTFPEEVRLVELSSEPESDVIGIFRAAAAVTVIDPQAHQKRAAAQGAQDCGCTCRAPR